MSCIGGICVIFASALRAFFGKKVPRRIFWYIWLIISIKLLIPVNTEPKAEIQTGLSKFIESQVSIFQNVPFNENKYLKMNI